MAKRKDSVALFEVIKGKDKRTEPLNVPGWMQKNEAKLPSAEQSADEAPAANDDTADAAQTEGGSAERPVQTKPSHLAGSPLASEPLVVVTQEGIKLSLKRSTLYVAALVLLVLITGTFMAGRASKSDAGSDLGPVPAKDDGSEAALTGGETSGEMAAAPVQRVLGKYYLVVQDVLGASQAHEEQARLIVAFLASNNEPATVRLWSVNKKRTFVVWSGKTFNSADEPAATEYVRKIEKLGEQYRKQGGAYNFKQSGKPWFLICTESLLKEPQQFGAGR